MFRKKAYGQHHKTVTPLTEVPNMDLIQDVIVSDRLHLIDLGVVKRLLFGWRDGTLGFATKFSSKEIEELSTFIRAIQLPSEIHRKMRTSNVHNVQHITDEVERFGHLNTLSAYAFENELFRIKHMLRHGHKSLEQVAKRLSEVHYDDYYMKTKTSKFPKTFLPYETVSP